MSREIKFRAWDNHRKQWITDGKYDVVGIDLSGDLIKCHTEDCESPFSYYDDKNIELMQFTGLKDKNGREIYEGDIVFYGNDTDPNPVIFDNQMFCVPVGMGVHKTHLHIMGGENKWMVIGNIYENPELIKLTER